MPLCAQVEDPAAHSKSTLRKVDELLDLDVVRRDCVLDAAVIDTAQNSVLDVFRRASATDLCPTHTTACTRHNVKISLPVGSLPVVLI